MSRYAPRCRIWWFLLLCGAGLCAAGGYLFSGVHAAELECAVVRTRLEQMAEDVAAIKRIMESRVGRESGR